MIRAGAIALALAAPAAAPVDRTGTVATRAAKAHQQLVDARGRALDGTGVSIAIIDTGVDPTHPAFRLPDGSTKVERSLTTFCAQPAAAECPQDVPDPASTNTDLAPPGGHGTHVAGIAVGDQLTLTDGTRVGGVAPGARLVMISASTALVDIEGALRWVLRHHAAPCAGCPPIRVVSNSWGANSDVVLSLQRALARAGVMTVWATGNQGGDGSTSQSNPAGVDPTPGILSAADYDDGGTGTRNGHISPGSSRGQADRPETWPDISAPGTGIISSCRPYLWICTALGREPHDGPGPGDVGTYEPMTGTSMSAPAIAGIVALLFQADGAATPARVEDVLKATAYKYRDGARYQRVGASTSSYDKGAGLADAYAAARALGAFTRSG